MTGAGRPLLIQFVLISAACLGGWFLVIQPMSRELAGLQARAAAATDDSGTLQVLASDLAERTAAIRAQAEAFQRRNDATGTSADLYGLVKVLAESHGVEVMRITPGRSTARHEIEATSTLFMLTVEGEYVATVEFVDELRAVGGFVRIQRVALVPAGTDRDPRVSATIEFESLRFNVPPPLTAFLDRGKTDAAPTD